MYWYQLVATVANIFGFLLSPQSYYSYSSTYLLNPHRSDIICLSRALFIVMLQLPYNTEIEALERYKNTQWSSGREKRPKGLLTCPIIFSITDLRDQGGVTILSQTIINYFVESGPTTAGQYNATYFLGNGSVADDPSQGKYSTPRQQKCGCLTTRDELPVVSNSTAANATEPVQTNSTLKAEKGCEVQCCAGLAPIAVEYEQCGSWLDSVSFEFSFWGPMNLLVIGAVKFLYDHRRSASKDS
jgi:hypothetical protein